MKNYSIVIYIILMIFFSCEDVQVEKDKPKKIETKDKAKTLQSDPKIASK